MREKNYHLDFIINYGANKFSVEVMIEFKVAHSTLLITLDILFFMATGPDITQIKIEAFLFAVEATISRDFFLFLD